MRDCKLKRKSSSWFNFRVRPGPILAPLETVPWLEAVEMARSTDWRTVRIGSVRRLSCVCRRPFGQKSRQWARNPAWQGKSVVAKRQGDRDHLISSSCFETASISTRPLIFDLFPISRLHELFDPVAVGGIETPVCLLQLRGSYLTSVDLTQAFHHPRSSLRRLPRISSSIFPSLPCLSPNAARRASANVPETPTNRPRVLLAL